MFAHENKLLSEKEKAKIKKKLEKEFAKILEILGFDWQNDPNLQGTPRRIAKMYVEELLSGCYTEPPKITVFPNDNPDELLIVSPIKVKSLCSHHFVPFYGYAHIAVITGDKLMGLSKYARIVEWFARRPQLQENLTKQIADYIQELINPKGVLVVLECRHLCMGVRGVNDEHARFITQAKTGVFREDYGLTQRVYGMMHLKKF